MRKEEVETPMMRQYKAMKREHPDAILLFRVGDFYETYGEDAVRESKILGIALTHRSNGGGESTEMAGFPYHALDTYLPKLVRAGARVAICDQMENPKLTKTLVKREITELVTPGVSIDDNVLERKENNWLCALHFNKSLIGLSFLDISTGEFLLSEGDEERAKKLIGGFAPKEILYNRDFRERFKDLFGNQYLTYEQEDWIYTLESAENRLTKHFETTSLNGFGVRKYESGIVAAGAILYYLDHTHHNHVNHITTLSRLDEDQYVWLDSFTIRNLELFGERKIRGANVERTPSLLEVIDRTITPMGGRQMNRWVAFPLKEKSLIEERLDVVGTFYDNRELTERMTTLFRSIGDLERLTSKIATRRINPREVVQLRIALDALAEVKELMVKKGGRLSEMGKQMDLCEGLANRIAQELTDNPPFQLSKGGYIRTGFDSELDDLRDISTNGRKYLTDLEEREVSQTGIPSLKVGFNNVFGYYFEVRNAHRDKVPPEWIRKQTLVNAERYITQELKEYEEKIISAQERIDLIENRLYQELLDVLIPYIPVLQKDSQIVADVDCMMGLAIAAEENDYHTPEIAEDYVIDIKCGRHPVIEHFLPMGEPYISNDVYLDNDSQQILMITGPNMAGKSALLRQTALIVLMAQIGSFVPAKSAHIGIVDKIFTRVGASDNLSAGESTFMVEMSEAASIMNNLSSRSLVLFDELGRGTSTYDGMSIAWAIVEYLHENQKHRAKTLFATHYHELNEMEKHFDRIKNYSVQVKEVDGRVVFLRKLTKGGSEHSFGIHVAKLAGMPKSIVKRAGEILAQLESASSNNTVLKKSVDEIAENRGGMQLSFFQLDDPVLKSVRDEILNLDVNNLTPIEALNKLNEIKKIVKGKE